MVPNKSQDNGPSDQRSQSQANGSSAPSSTTQFWTVHDGQPAPETDEAGYRIREQEYGTKRQIRVVVMGAGASTLNFLKKAEEQLEKVDIVCYEKNNDVGGTWLENRYPGVFFRRV